MPKWSQILIERDQCNTEAVVFQISFTKIWLIADYCNIRNSNSFRCLRWNPQNKSILKYLGQKCNWSIQRFLKKNANPCVNLYETFMLVVIPKRESQERFLQWCSWAEWCPGIDKGSTWTTVAHVVHWNLVCSVSLNAAFSHPIFKGRGVVIYATAVYTILHQD